MEPIFRDVVTADKDYKEWVYTIGNFDGVHVGHRAVISRVREVAQELGAGSGIITFDPHPKQLLNPSVPQPVLYPAEHRIDYLSDLGVDRIVVVRFDHDFSAIDPSEFINKFILEKLNTVFLCVGYDFNFGKNRSGSFETISSIFKSKNLGCELIPPVRIGDVTISSSLIRRLLFENRFSEASKYLGRDWIFKGKVAHGDRRGRLLGFPTLNLPSSHKLPIRNGVYISKTLTQRGYFNGVTNVGLRPTFGSNTSITLVETNLFDFNAEIYGEEIEVFPLHFLREEKKFENLDSLIAQIHKDAVSAREYFKKNG